MDTLSILNQLTFQSLLHVSVNLTRKLFLKKKKTNDFRRLTLSQRPLTELLSLAALERRRICETYQCLHA